MTMHPPPEGSFSIGTDQVGLGVSAMRWFKLYAEFATDPKVQSMTESMQRRLMMLFCLHCNGDLEKLDDDELALALRITPKELQRTRETFARKGFIGDDWRPRNWEKRQSVTDRTAAERMRRYRERLREEDRNVTRNGDVTFAQPFSGARAGAGAGEEVEVETEGEVDPPTPPSIILGSEYKQVGEWAIELAGDFSWGRWVDRQGKCGHHAATIRRAIEMSSGAGKLTQAYVAAKLQAWASEGEPQASGNARRPSDPPTPKVVRKGDPRS